MYMYMYVVEFPEMYGMCLQYGECTVCVCVCVRVCIRSKISK